MRERNQILLHYIKLHFQHLEKEGREVNADLLCELIQQHNFDYEIEKAYPRDGK